MLNNRRRPPGTDVFGWPVQVKFHEVLSIADGVPVCLGC